MQGTGENLRSRCGKPLRNGRPDSPAGAGNNNIGQLLIHRRKFVFKESSPNPLNFAQIKVK
jgi:hypothetical protein